MVPGLAESWELDDATNTYTFHLRDDVNWHDGEKFTADDVEFTIKAIMDPDNESEIASNYEDVTAINVIDDKTISFTLRDKNVAFLRNTYWKAKICRQMNISIIQSERGRIRFRSGMKDRVLHL